MMLILALDERHGLSELEITLRELLGSNLHFCGFQDANKLLIAAEQHGYDIVFADMTCRERNGIILLGELAFRYPQTNYIGTAETLCEQDAMTMHRLHGGYITKPYCTGILADTLANLRYSARKPV